MISCKSFGHEKWKNAAGLAINFGWGGVLFDLTPGYGLVWPRAAVRTIELARGVQKYAKVCSVALKKFKE